MLIVYLYGTQKIDVDKLECVQKRATKLHVIPELSKKSYSDRLKALKLPTLKYRRYRKDMIELFKIIKGIYHPACVPHFEYTELTDNLIRTKGKKFKLVQHHCHYNLRKYNFTNRVIPIWNNLSNYVVSAETDNTFKNRLDKFWLDHGGWIIQEVMYDYKINRSSWHREPQYSLLVIIHIDNVTYFKLCLGYRCR